jgi:outer membrane biosynthesis protein TonB
VRYGLIGSIILHIVIFGLVIFNFMGRKDDTPAPPPVPVSVEIMSPKDYSERQAGKIEGKAEKPAPPAEVKAPEATASAKKEVIEPTPAPKAAEKQAVAPPPPPPAPAPTAAPAPAPAPKPVEQAKTEPKPEKPIEKAAPKKVAKKEEAPKPKPKPETPKVKFDPAKIAAEVKTAEDDAPRPFAAQSMEAKPSKTYADRQSAVLSRDQYAGAPAGEWNPSQPWRPASSLQDQAMGVPNARGAMNAGTCADAIQSRIEQAWILPIGQQSAESTVIRLHIEISRDGTLLRPPTVMDPAYTPVQQAMADAALRAAESAQPYNIPPQQYEQCRNMILRFNPRDMYGG